jgi:hypothetical protein
MTTISIQCTHCHKRYNAPATMAGKKVKCKHCAKVFQIPAGEAEPVENDAPQADVPAPFRAVKKPAAAALASAGEQGAAKAPAGGKLGQASAGYAAKMARNENAVEVELADHAAPMVMLRPSIPHDFPGSAVLDQWGPVVMAVLGLGLLSLMAMKSNLTGPNWVGTTRLGAYLFLCLCVSFPLGFLSLRMAARKCRLMLPPMAALRALGTFSLAFALPLVFWLSGETVTMLVIGTLMGAGLLCAAVWFFFRLQSQEMSTVLGAAGSAFVGSILISYLALMGVNAIFASSARSSPNNQLASSPMGPTFDWDVPVGEIHKPPKVVAVIPPVRSDDTAPKREKSSTEPATVEPTQPQPSTAIAEKPTDPVKTVEPVKPANPESVPTPPPTHPDTTTTSAPPPEHPVVVAPAPALSPLVAKVTTVADLGDFNQVIFPAGTGNVVVAMKKGQTDETVAFFSGNPLTMKGETKFEIEKELKQRYCVSGNGETLARLTTFPKLSILLWNIAANKEAKVIPLNAEHGKPELLGFGFNDNLVVLWNTGPYIDVEVINTKATPPLAVVGLRLKTFDRSACNPTISPDGRQMAVATFFEKKGGLDLWDLTTNRRAELRTCYVPLGTWVTPLSITYASTGGQISAYFELGTKGVIYSFRTGDAGLMHELPYRTLPYATGVSENFTGRTLDYLDPNTYLLLGRPLIDVETGKVLGELEIENVRAQHVIDKETVLLHTQSPEGKNQLLEVKLKEDVILARRAEARGKKTP